jgi:transglutaminase-like putative cysteine protease
MRSDRRRKAKRKAKKRFYGFLLMLLTVMAIFVFRDNIGSALALIGNTEKPSEGTKPPVSTTRPSSVTPKPTAQVDTEPPVIEGEDFQVVYVGDTATYRKYVTVHDNHDKNVKLEVDSSDVMLHQEGKYKVIYTATDAAGNSSVKEVEIRVEQKPAHLLEKEKVDEAADKLLEEILEPGMTKRQQARAIYDWVRNNIYYDGNYQNNTDWVQAASDGFRNRRGDCYVYFGTAKALLNRAEITNMDIVKAGGGHYWSLVDLGEGWYHYDTTPRKTGGEFFMLTDAELTTYSEEIGKGSHVWDADEYPATPLK